MVVETGADAPRVVRAAAVLVGLEGVAAVAAALSFIVRGFAGSDRHIVNGFGNAAWFGILAPAGLPPAVLARLGAETDAVARDAGFRARMAELGGELPGLTPDGGTSPAAFQTFLAEERARWAEVVQKSGAKAE